MPKSYLYYIFFILEYLLNSINFNVALTTYFNIRQIRNGNRRHIGLTFYK